MSTRPPSGTPPPTAVEMAGLELDLVALAREVCERYHVHYADEHERYGPAAVDWCRHDNQWLLSWAADDVLGMTDLDEQASWLARVLHARGFPVARLVHDLRIAADVAQERVLTADGAALAGVLERAAATVDALEFE